MEMIDSELISRLAQRYGTPYYVYDAAVIRRQIAALRSFDSIRFAQKANSNVHILRLMRSAGVWVDAVSAGEIQRALAAGYSGATTPAGLVYTADVLPADALELVVGHGIPVNAGSLAMLDRLGRRSPGHPVWLRVNPGFGHGHSHKVNTGGVWSKHGIWYAELPEALARVGAYGLRLAGLHMHIGSGSDLEHLQRVCAAMVETVRLWHMDIAAISSGGGLPIPYRPNDLPFDPHAFFNLWHAARRQIEALVGHPVALETEPGRFLVAQAGWLVSQALVTKRVGDNHYVLVDAGFDNLVRPAMYGSYHEISVIRPDGTPATGPLRSTVVGGPLCEAGDVFTQDAAGSILPRALPPIAVGDRLVFHDAGAYAATMASTYNSRPLAPEILIDGDSVLLIRRRQTMADLLALELAMDGSPTSFAGSPSRDFADG